MLATTFLFPKAGFPVLAEVWVSFVLLSLVGWRPIFFAAASPHAEALILTLTVLCEFV